MGGNIMGNKFDKTKVKSDLSCAITRINIHRQKKLNSIAKTKDTVCGHLNSQNEVNAKIYTETLINDENKVPCYDIASTMCDQVKGRTEYIAQFGPPPDMTQTFATLIHIAPKLEVEELIKVRKQLVSLLGKEFCVRADEDKNSINPVIAENIDFIKPDDGHIIYRMRQLAKERNIQYEPSYDMKLALNSYLDRKGLSDPFDEGNRQPYQAQMPAYNPGMPPQGGNNMNQGFGGPPPGGNMPIPQYMPQQPMQPPQGGMPMAPPHYQPMQPGMPPMGGQPQQMQTYTTTTTETTNVAMGQPIPGQPPVYDPNMGMPSVPTGQIGGDQAKFNQAPVADNNNVDDLEERLKRLGGQ